MATTQTMRGTLDLMAGTVPTSTVGWTEHPRTNALMLLPRNERPRYESHPATISIARPAWSMFYRPRDEAAEMHSIGLDARAVSFHFLDIAMEDLGRWVGPLISDGWQRSEVTITAASGALFDDDIWVCFHHPEVAAPTRLPLSCSPRTIDAKCFIHQPTGDVSPTPATPEGQTTGAPAAEPSGLQDEITPTATTAGTSPATPTDLGTAEPVIITEPSPSRFESAPRPESEPAAVASSSAAATFSDAGSTGTDDATQEDAEVEGDEEEEGPPPESATEVELRQTILLLKEDGLDVAAVMSDENFLEVSERASIEGVDVWSMVIEIIGQ